MLERQGTVYDDASPVSSEPEKWERESLQEYLMKTHRRMASNAGNIFFSFFYNNK